MRRQYGCNVGQLSRLGKKPCISHWRSLETILQVKRQLLNSLGEINAVWETIRWSLCSTVVRTGVTRWSRPGQIEYLGFQCLGSPEDETDPTHYITFGNRLSEAQWSTSALSCKKLLGIESLSWGAIIIGLKEKHNWILFTWQQSGQGKARLTKEDPEQSLGATM